MIFQFLLLLQLKKRVNLILSKVNRNSIPNLLTISRFLLGFLSIIFYGVFLLKESPKSGKLFFNTLFTLGFFALTLSIITDYLDGFLARKWNCQSKFGKLYDPLADKIIVSIFLIFFATKNIVHWILPFLSILREIVVEWVRYRLKKIKVILQAINTAKYKTIFQFTALIFTYIFASYYLEIGNLLFLPSLLLSFYSLARYLQIYWRYY